MDNSFLIKLGLDTQKLVDGVNRGNSILDGFANKITGLASTIGVAFGVQQVVSFSTEMIKLAGVTDGVRQAFNKLADSARVLSEMKAATKGTVTDLDLMKAAVQANNFSIPIEQLGSLFEFAYERAKATGQSVDYLVNSIIVGIGRKSPLILDNLGISAVNLKEKLGGVTTEAATVGQVAEAVGKIASESMEKFGRSAETAAEKIAKVETNIENLNARIGTGIAFVFDPLLEGLNSLTGGANKSAGELESFIYESGRKNRLGEDLGVISEMAEKAGVNLATFTSKYEVVNKMIETIRILNAEKNNLVGPGKAGVFNPFFGGEDDQKSVGLIQRIKEEIKRLGEAKEGAFGPNAQEQIARYNREIEKLKTTLEQLNKIGTGSKDKPVIPGLNLGTGAIPTISGMIDKMGPGANGPLGFGPESRSEMLNTADAMLQVQQRSEKLAKTLSHSLGGAVIGLAEGFGQLAAGMNVNMGAVALDAIGSMAVQLGSVLIAEGIAIEAFKESLASLNGATAIAAGVALVAAGTAFKATAANIASSGGRSQGAAAPPMPRMADNNITLNGEWKIRGADLIYLLEKQGYRKAVAGG